MTNFHPIPAQLEAFVEGTLDESTALQIEALIDSGEISSHELDECLARSPAARALRRHVQTDPDELSLPPGLLSKVTESFHGLVTIPTPSESPSEFPAGHQLGPYVLRGVNGRGGMSTVYRAFDPELEREVAVKVLSPALADLADARERFLREARAAACVHHDHDHVLPIHAVSSNASPPWLAMPLVDGMTLEQRLELSGGSLPAEEVRSIAMEVAAGLAAAHEAGIVHRDIKPGNILIEETTGRALVADFGLACTSVAKRLTSPDALAGTPQFMSPEQVQGKPVSFRSDLFSLGGLLFLMLSGRPPFAGDSAPAVLQAITNGHAPSLREAHPETPRWLAALVDRLLERSPDRRPSSAHEVVRLLDERRAPGGPSRRQRRRRLVAFVAGLFLLAVGTFVGLELSGRTSVVNRLLAQSNQHPCFIRGQWGTFLNLSEALAAAPEHGRIEILARSSLNSPTLHIEKPVTIASALGEPVTIRHESPKGSLFHISASTNLENVGLLQTPRDVRQEPLVSVDDSILRLSHCHLSYTKRGLSSWRQRKGVGLIRLTGRARVEIDASLLYTMHGAAVVARSSDGPNEFHITVHDSAIYACFLLANLLRPDSAPVTLDIRNSTYAGSDLVHQPKGGQLPSLRIVGSHNVIEAQALVMAGGDPSGEFAKSIDWSMNHNLYSLFDHITRSAFIDRRRDRREQTVAYLQGLWPGSDGQSRFVRTIGIHRQLSKAVPPPEVDHSYFALPDTLRAAHPEVGIRR